MRPVVAVMPLVDDERESLWMLPGYMNALREAGAVPFMPALTTDRQEIGQIFGMCDGLVMTGGHDVNPACYGESDRYGNLHCCDARDEMELALLERAVASDKPVLGICRGLQIMNIFCGGTLYQDLPSEHPSDVDHHQPPPYGRPAHHVHILSRTPLREDLHDTDRAVNRHHQAICKLGEGLDPMAISEDGLVEAIYRPRSAFYRAVQWHPEHLYKVDEPNRCIFRSFVNACTLRD